MSDGKDTVTGDLEVHRDLLDAMRRVRVHQRSSRNKRSGELSEESPATVITELLTEAYSADLRRARNHGASGGPVGASRRYTPDS